MYKPKITTEYCYCDECEKEHLKTRHLNGECDCPYSTKPKRIGRCNYVCPICRRDVSLEMVLIEQLKDN